MSRFAEIALNLPLDRLFTYAVPEEFRGRVQPGVRVRVPFQSRTVGGTCIALSRERPEFATRAIHGLIDPEPLFTPAMLRLARWIARRYGASLGEALDAALPFAIRTGSKRRRARVARLKIAPEAVAPAVLELEEKFEKQARTLRILGAAGGRLEQRELLARAHVGASPLASLVKRGLVAVESEEVAASLAVAPPPHELDKELTAEQRAALAEVSASIAARHHRTFLLFGVTGSGKTEVYLQALREIVAQGRQGIVLVPEIALTPQTVSRFLARFERVAVLHSHLTDAERHDQWRAIQRGDADVVIGARSAIFAPTPRLGLVVVDEEHEGTFKQQNAPRYDARDVARARARLERAVLLLGSATPALESWHRAESGRATLLRLSARVAGGRFPETIVADLNQTVPTGQKRRHLTDRLHVSVQNTVARGEQVILFLNRRGYATSAICGRCGAVQRCTNCDVSLVHHRRIGRLICHYCGHERRLPEVCEACRGAFRLVGFGTERIEDEVRAALPDARVARMDSDTMQARGSHEKVLSAFRDGKVDVLVGTQMIGKGLDVPNVTLVGVVSADTVLDLPDYRSTERTFAMIAQVAGRAGRGPRGGTVIVQTQHPDHFAIRLALVPDYERFAAQELEARKKDGYPPYGHLARLVVHGPEAGAAGRYAEQARDHLGEWIADDESTLLGPAPCPISVINGQHRFHVVVKSAWRSSVQRFVRVVRGLPRPKGRIRILVDVDPWAMM